MRIEEVRRLSANDVGQVVLLVDVAVHLFLAVHGELVQDDKCALGLHFVDFFFRVPLCYLADGPILPFLLLPYPNRADCGTFKRSQQNVVPKYTCHPVV